MSFTSQSHQTVRLTAGRHRSRDDGVCVMELASMLAGEPFGDHPMSVCPVIAGFLRSYNDHLEPVARQDLYWYAARVVGTRADPATERVRARMCACWARDVCDSPPLRVRILHKLFHGQGPDVDGVYAARAAIASPSDVTHGRALAFLNELIKIGADPERQVGTALPTPRLPNLLAAR